eukprot:EG_transcript_60930
MAVETTFRTLSRTGLLPLAPEVGVEALRQLLFCASAPVVMVCPLDVARLPAVPYFSALRPSGAAAPVDSARGGTVGALPGWLAALEAGNPETRRQAILGKVEEVALASGV